MLLRFQPCEADQEAHKKKALSEGHELPMELSEALKVLEQQRKGCERRYFGAENAGNSCYLQAILMLLAVHEEFLESNRELEELRHVVRKSRRSTVPRASVESLRYELKEQGLVSGSACHPKSSIALKLTKWWMKKPLRQGFMSFSEPLKWRKVVHMARA